MINTNQIKSKWIHILIWSIFFILMVAVSAPVFGVTNSLLNSFFNIFIKALIFYLNYIIFLPLFLEKKKYIKYFGFIILTIILGVLFSSLIDITFFDPEALARGGHFQKEDIKQAPKHMFLVRNSVLNTISLLAILFISTIFRGITDRQKDDLNKIKLKNKIIEAESKFLKSQINPHFIFNALNNIYSLSQIQSPKTPDAIHKLSQILRYVIYDNSEKFVNLEKEIDYINSYIDLQKMKDDAIGDNININIKIANNNIKIAPMLLIPFIENSFKHSYIEDTDNGWINIKIETKENKLIFECSNSIPEIDLQKDRVGGIGLDNVRKRIELIYPEKHDLIIDQNENIYSVKLIIYT